MGSVPTRLDVRGTTSALSDFVNDVKFSSCGVRASDSEMIERHRLGSLKSRANVAQRGTEYEFAARCLSACRNMIWIENIDIDSTRKMAIIGLGGKFGKLGNVLLNGAGRNPTPRKKAAIAALRERRQARGQIPSTVTRKPRYL